LSVNSIEDNCLEHLRRRIDYSYEGIKDTLDEKTSEEIEKARQNYQESLQSAQESFENQLKRKFNKNRKKLKALIDENEGVLKKQIEKSLNSSK
jgi:F0F1-type ATP synthase membrane subunit b/b'